MEDLLEKLDRDRSVRAWGIAIGIMVVLFAFLPLAAVFSWARFFVSSQGNGSGLGQAAVAFVVFASALYLTVIAPFLHSGFLVPEEKPERLMVAFALWALPLASFAYWLGDFRNNLHAYDLVLFVFAALVAPLILYWRTGERAVLTLLTASIFFVPLFIIEDILGPFSPLFVYASDSTWLYTLRTLGVVLAITFAALIPVPRLGRAKSRLPAFRAIVISLCLLAFVNDLSCWVWRDLESADFVWDFNWLGFLGMYYFFSRGDIFGRRAFVLVAALQAGSLLWQMIQVAGEWDSSVWTQGRLCYMAMGLVFSVNSLLFFLRRGKVNFFAQRYALTQLGLHFKGKRV